jgi:acyl-CoA reductase-like NAD-dependent aldehyde dehydrogenase
METALLVDNRERAARDQRSFERRNPITGTLASRNAAATTEDAVAAVESCAAAFPGWAATTPEARRRILLKAADLLESRTNDFFDVVMDETGAPATWTGLNVYLAANLLREAAALTTQIKGEVLPANKPGMFSMALRRPVGVVLSIAPWNAPIILAVRSFATALACGNTVVLKASELSSATHFLLVRMMHEAGLPPGVLNLITNAPADAGKVVEAMIAHPAVRRVNFTGSTRIGRIIAEVAARHLKPVLLELGGKAPLLVLKDAAVDQAVRAAAFGAYMHQGQICMSTERVVVDKTIADELAGKLAAKAATLSAGDPKLGSAQLGAMITPEAATRIQALIDEAVSKGAKLLAGRAPQGALMDAALLDHVTPEMRIYHEESFGPITCIVRVADVEEAIRAANDTEYGLSSAIFTSDITLALQIAQRLDFGACHINGPTVYDEAHVPLGGMKASGWGRFGGTPGIHEFTEIQWVTIEDPGQPYPI